MIGLTIMEFIRSVAFEGEAYSIRTISLDSSTTVDDMSKITSLDINLEMKSTKSSEKGN